MNGWESCACIAACCTLRGNAGELRFTAATRGKLFVRWLNTARTKKRGGNTRTCWEALRGYATASSGGLGRGIGCARLCHCAAFLREVEGRCESRERRGQTRAHHAHNSSETVKDGNIWAGGQKVTELRFANQKSKRDMPGTCGKPGNRRVRICNKKQPIYRIQMAKKRRKFKGHV